MTAAPIDFLFSLLPLEADPRATGVPFTHDRGLVALSMLLAVISGYAFLELVARAQTHSRFVARLWNGAAGLMFGACIWFTHFVGLLAVQSPLLHGFVLWPTVASAIAGFGCGGLTFLVAGARLSWLRLLGAGLCAGAGAIVMHYLGMRGLEIEAELSYRLAPVAVTSMGALVCSIAALWIAHRLETWWARAAVAMPMGAVVAGLHYTDMAGAIITPRPEFVAPAADFPDMGLVLGAALICAVLVLIALLAVALDSRAPQRDGAEEHIVVIPHPRGQSATEDPGDVVVLPPRRPRVGD